MNHTHTNSHTVTQAPHLGCIQDTPQSPRLRVNSATSCCCVVVVKLHSMCASELTLGHHAFWVAKTWLCMSTEQQEMDIMEDAIFWRCLTAKTPFRVARHLGLLQGDELKVALVITWVVTTTPQLCNLRVLILGLPNPLLLCHLYHCMVAPFTVWWIASRVPAFSWQKYISNYLHLSSSQSLQCIMGQSARWQNGTWVHSHCRVH